MKITLDIPDDEKIKILGLVSKLAEDKLVGLFKDSEQMEIMVSKVIERTLKKKEFDFETMLKKVVKDIVTEQSKKRGYWSAGTCFDYNTIVKMTKEIIKEKLDNEVGNILLTAFNKVDETVI